MTKDELVAYAIEEAKIDTGIAYDHSSGEESGAELEALIVDRWHESDVVSYATEHGFPQACFRAYRQAFLASMSGAER